MINTIKKIYKHASIALCIGLLSLNSLSSCVNTRQALGANTPIEQKQSEPFSTKTKSCNSIRRFNPLCYALAFVGMVTTFIPLTLWAFFSLFDSSLNSPTTPNPHSISSNNVTTSRSFMLAGSYTGTTLLNNTATTDATLRNITPTQEASIISVITKGLGTLAANKKPVS